MIKNLTKLIHKETEEEWQVSKRTRGADIPGEKGQSPTQTWVLILTDKEGHRQFIPEGRIWEFFHRPEDN